MDKILFDCMPDENNAEIQFSVAREEWFRLFSVVYTLINAGPNPYSQNLYNNVRQYLLQVVDMKQNEISKMESDSEMETGEKQPVLTQYHYYWKQYSSALIYYDQMYHNLNSYYIRNHRQSEQSYMFTDKKPVEVKPEEDANARGMTESARARVGAQTRSRKAADSAAQKNYEAIECNGNYPIKELGLRVWKHVMCDSLKHSIIPKLLKIVEAHRDGDHATIKKLLKGATRENLEDDSVLFPIVQEIISSLITDTEQQPNNRKSSAFQFYQAILEKPYLDATFEFAHSFSEKIKTGNKPAEYVKTMMEMIKAENLRADKFMHEFSKDKLTSICTKIFVQEQKDFILQDVQEVIENEKWDQFQDKFILLRDVNEGLRDLCKHYQNHLERVGEEKTQQVIRIPKKFVDTVLQFNNDAIEHVKKLFKDPLDKNKNSEMNTSKDFIRAVDNACKTIVNLKEKGTNQKQAPASTLLAQFCDVILREKDKESEWYLKNLKDAVSVFHHIEDRDLFEQFYRQKLAGRLIKNTTESMEAETTMIDNLRLAAGYDFTSPLNRMMKDVKICKVDSDKFTHKILECKVIQQGAWPFQKNKKALNLPTEIEKMLTSFEEFYREQHNTTKLNWLHDWSSCSVVYTHNEIKYTLTARPCQYLILNMFQEKSEFLVSFVRESTGIEFLELERYLWSLQRSGILVLEDEGEKATQQIEMGTTVKLNSEFASKRTHIDLWKKFRESKPVQRSGNKRNRGATDISEIKKSADHDAPTVDSDDESEGTNKRVEDDRRIFLQAALVRVIKKEQKISHNKFIADTISMATARFKPSISQVKNAIEVLIDKQYIERLQPQDEKDNGETHYQYIS